MSHKVSYNKQFFVLTADLKERIRLKQKVSPVDFTILTSSFSGQDEPGVELLKQCINTFPNVFIRNLVCLLPVRLVEHEILAQLQAGIKLDKQVEDEVNTFGSAFTLVQQGMAHSNIEDECLKMYSTTLEEMHTFYNDLDSNTLKDSYLFSSNELSALKSFYYDNTSTPAFSNKELLKAACVQRGMALIYTNRAQEMIEPIVKKVIDHQVEQGHLKKLDYVSKEEGLAIFTTGGVASGKGTCLVNIQSALLERSPSPITWEQLVHHNADRLKLFLQRPEFDPQKYSQYTYEEALLVKERTMQLIAKQGMIAGDKYPHFLHDQTKLKPDELREANRRYGEVIITAISTEVSSSIQWAYGRGKTTNRYEHTEGLLGSHQAVPGEMIKSLNQNELIGSGKISVAMYDNNSPSRELTMFASIDMKNKSIIVYNDVMMQNWINKENINPKAKPGDPLYFDRATRTTTEYFAPLVDKGFTLQISELELEKTLQNKV